MWVEGIGGKERGRIWKGYVHNCCAKLCKNKKKEERAELIITINTIEALEESYVSLSISVQFLNVQNVV